MLPANKNVKNGTHTHRGLSEIGNIDLTCAGIETYLLHDPIYSNVAFSPICIYINTYE